MPVVDYLYGVSMRSLPRSMSFVAKCTTDAALKLMQVDSHLRLFSVPDWQKLGSQIILCNGGSWPPSHRVSFCPTMFFTARRPCQLLGHAVMYTSIVKGNPVKAAARE